jgi:FkbM family methyltransferase
MKKLHWSLLKRLYRLRSRFGVYSRLNRKWMLDNRNWIDQQLIIRRPYEVGQLARCRQFIHEHRLQYFFDIGANFGLYSMLLSDEPSLSHLHAFEPLPRNAHQFGANLYLNGLDNRVHLHICALSDHSGQIDFFVDPNSTGVSTLLPAEMRSRQDAYKTSIQVESRVFDEAFSFSGIRALIKMDVEGAELMTLAGMRRFLSDNVAVLQVETTPQTLDQVDAFMGEAGYRSLGRLGADAYYGNI